MKQFTLPLNLSHRRTRKREFLEAMERAVPWTALLALIAPLSPRKRTGRPPFALEAMLRIHFLQQWFSVSDLAMEEALFDVPFYREFAGLGGMSRLPDRVSILRFRHLLEEHWLAEQFLQVVNDHLAKAGLMLKEGTMVDATLIAALSSTKNQGGGARSGDASS
jgi:IS5 family transposase